MRRIVITLVVLLVLLVAVGVAIALLRGENVAYESPSYRVVETIGPVEIRRYESYVVAEAEVDGPLEEAGSQGFRILAGYIFGGNHGNQRIAMTTPVIQEPEGTKIAMTAPVTQSQTGERFTLQFMMPTEYSLETLPMPNDSRVSFREVPARTLAAIRYSGTWSRRNYQTHLDELVETLAKHGFDPVGEPVWARYNGPFTPWFMRRNEILTAFERPDA